MSKATSDAVKRAVRTFVQAAIGVFLALVVSGNVSHDVPQFSALKAAALAAIWAGFIALLSWIQNALEESTGTEILPK